MQTKKKRKKNIQHKGVCSNLNSKSSLIEEKEREKIRARYRVQFANMIGSLRRRLGGRLPPLEEIRITVYRPSTLADSFGRNASRSFETRFPPSLPLSLHPFSHRGNSGREMK